MHRQRSGMMPTLLRLAYLVIWLAGCTIPSQAIPLGPTSPIREGAALLREYGDRYPGEAFDLSGEHESHFDYGVAEHTDERDPFQPYEHHHASGWNQASLSQQQDHDAGSSTALHPSAVLHPDYRFATAHGAGTGTAPHAFQPHHYDMMDRHDPGSTWSYGNPNHQWEGHGVGSDVAPYSPVTSSPYFPHPAGYGGGAGTPAGPPPPLPDQLRGATGLRSQHLATDRFDGTSGRWVPPSFPFRLLDHHDPSMLLDGNGQAFVDHHDALASRRVPGSADFGGVAPRPVGTSNVAPSHLPAFSAGSLTPRPKKSKESDRYQKVKDLKLHTADDRLFRADPSVPEVQVKASEEEKGWVLKTYRHYARMHGKVKVEWANSDPAEAQARSRMFAALRRGNSFRGEYPYKAIKVNDYLIYLKQEGHKQDNEPVQYQVVGIPISKFSEATKGHRAPYLDFGVLEVTANRNE